MNDDHALALLKASDPVDPVGLAGPTSPHAAALRERIVSAPRTEPSPARPARRRLLVLTAAVLTAVAVVALPASRTLSGWLPDGSTAQAATPPLLTPAHSPRSAGAAEELARIADRTQALPDDTGTGDAVEISYETWSLFTRDDGVQTRSEVVPQSVTRSLDADGAGTVTTRSETDAGRVSESVEEIRGQAVRALPTTLEGITVELEKRNPSGAAGAFNAVVETLLERPAPPASRAALLRYLSRAEGLTSVGTITDRLGRDGTGFAVESDASGLPTRYLLVVDPDTGRFLGYEEMLTTDAGKLNVAVPSVIQYTAWETSTFVTRP